MTIKSENLISANDINEIRQLIDQKCNELDIEGTNLTNFTKFTLLMNRNEANVIIQKYNELLTYVGIPERKIDLIPYDSNELIMMASTFENMKNTLNDMIVATVTSIDINHSSISDINNITERSTFNLRAISTLVTVTGNIFKLDSTRDVEWKSSDSGICEIDKDGVVTIKNVVGDRQVTITASIGSVNSSFTFNIHDVPLPIDLVINGPNIIQSYLKTDFNASYINDDGSITDADNNIIWSVGDPDKLFINPGTGEVSPNSELRGDVYTSITCTDNSISATKAITIKYSFEYDFIELWKSKYGSIKKFAFGKTSDGTIYSWGNNEYGCLGRSVGFSDQGIDKVDMSEVVGATFVKISPGINHVLAIDSEGYLYSWGDNAHCQLGNGTKGSMSTIPRRIDCKLNGINVKFKEISAGKYHCAAIDINSNLWMWGLGESGQLGNMGYPISTSYIGGSPFWKMNINLARLYIPSGFTDDSKYLKSPRIVIIGNNELIKKVVVSLDVGSFSDGYHYCEIGYTYVLTESNKLYTFGYYNRIGLGYDSVEYVYPSRYCVKPIPIWVPNDPGIKLLHHDFVVDTNGQKYNIRENIQLSSDTINVVEIRDDGSYKDSDDNFYPYIGDHHLIFQHGCYTENMFMNSDGLLLGVGYNINKTYGYNYYGYDNTTEQYGINGNLPCYVAWNEKPYNIILTGNPTDINYSGDYRIECVAKYNYSEDKDVTDEAFWISSIPEYAYFNSPGILTVTNKSFEPFELTITVIYDGIENSETININVYRTPLSMIINGQSTLNNNGFYSYNYKIICNDNSEIDVTDDVYMELRLNDINSQYYIDKLTANKISNNMIHVSDLISKPQIFKLYASYKGVNSEKTIINNSEAEFLDFNVYQGGFIDYFFPGFQVMAIAKYVIDGNIVDVNVSSESDFSINRAEIYVHSNELVGDGIYIRNLSNDWEYGDIQIQCTFNGITKSLKPTPYAEYDSFTVSFVYIGNNKVESYFGIRLNSYSPYIINSYKYDPNYTSFRIVTRFRNEYTRIYSYEDCSVEYDGKIRITGENPKIKAKFINMSDKIINIRNQLGYKFYL